MSKGERRRTMVYSNVNKKADSKSAFRDKIDLDDEIIIGLYDKSQLRNKKNSKISKEQVSRNKEKRKSELHRNNKIKNKDYSYEKSESDNTRSKKINSKDNFNKNTRDDVTRKKVANNKTSFNKTKSSKIQYTDTQLNNKQTTPPNYIKIKAIKRIGILTFLLITLIGGIVYFMLSPVFNIKTIEVLNNQHIASQEIIKKSSLQTGQNIFKYSKTETKNKILENPYIEKVNIKRNAINKKVSIIVDERKATLMLEYANSYAYIDNQGYILEISQNKLNSPIIKGYTTPVDEIKAGKRLNKEDLERLEIVLNIMNNANDKGIKDLITYIDVKDSKNYCMFLESEDKIVYLGKCTDLSTQMLYVKEMLEREKNKEGKFFINMDLNTSNPVFQETV